MYMYTAVTGNSNPSGSTEKLEPVKKVLPIRTFHKNVRGDGSTNVLAAALMQGYPAGLYSPETRENTEIVLGDKKRRGQSERKVLRGKIHPSHSFPIIQLPRSEANFQSKYRWY